METTVLNRDYTGGISGHMRCWSNLESQLFVPGEVPKARSWPQVLRCGSQHDGTALGYPKFETLSVIFVIVHNSTVMESMLTARSNLV